MRTRMFHRWRAHAGGGTPKWGASRSPRTDVGARRTLLVAARHVRADGCPECLRVTEMAAEGVPGEAGVFGT